MSTKERFKKGVPVRRITRGGDLYRVELANHDYLFLDREEKEALDKLKVDQSLRVSDIGRDFILWKERRKVLAYERAID
jgi:hypothetical protein